MNENLAYEVSEESEDSIRAICVMFLILNLWLLISWDWNIICD